MEHWTKITGLEGLYRHSNGTYYARLSQPRKTFRSLRTDKLREARKAIRVIQAANMKASPVIPKRNGRRTTTLGEVAESFLECKCPALPVTPKTRVRIRQSLNAIRNHTDLWGEPIAGLPGKTIARAIESAPRLSNASRNYMLYGLRKVFAYAEEQGILSENPAQGLKAFPVRPRRPDLPTDEQFSRLVRLLRYPESQRRKQPPLPKGWEATPRRALASLLGVSRATLGRIIATERGKPPPRKGRPEVAFAFLFLCYTGLRMGEARSVRWEDVDGSRIIVRGTKTSAAFRSIPIIPQLAALLTEIRAHRGKVEPGQPILGRKRIDKALRAACDELGLPRLRHHDLRHYFATKAIQAGVDVPTVAKWLGHSDGGVLAMKVYANVIDEHSRAQAAKLVFPG